MVAVASEGGMERYGIAFSHERFQWYIGNFYVPLLSGWIAYLRVRFFIDWIDYRYAGFLLWWVAHEYACTEEASPLRYD